MGKGKNKDKKVEFASSPDISIANPALAEFLGLTGYYGADLSEQQALGLTAVWRAQSLIAGTIAGLPMKVYNTDVDDAIGPGSRKEVPHFLSTRPAGPYDLSPFNWTETVMLHLLNHGEAYLKAVTNVAGELIGLWPIHPISIATVRWDGATKVFKVQYHNGQSEEFVTGEITQILGMTTDGLRGMSPLALFRQSFQTSRSGEMAANRTFTSGALMGGLVTTEEDIDDEQAKVIKASLRANIQGAEHAGDIAFVNRALKFSPWSMSAVDAQFLQSRAFQVDEVARMYGVPSHLLNSIEKQTSWGTGIAEQNLALARYTLMSWTSRIESALQSILPEGMHVEFNYSGLLAGTPEQEIALLIQQVAAGILTADEARAIRNLPPLPKSAQLPVSTTTTETKAA